MGISPELRVLGAEIRQLRKQRGLSLRQLSEQLRATGTTEGSSFQHLSAVERGVEWPAQELVVAIGTSLNARDRLLDAYREARAPSDDPTSARWMRKIEALITKGRVEAARAALLEWAERSDSDSEHIQVLLRLGDVEYLLDASDAGDAYYLEAAETAHAANLSRETAIALDRIGTRWTDAERYVEAAELVKSWLGRDVNNSRIWRRLGVIEWYGGDLAAAYAALTTALHLGHRRRNILHARGQVLAEWGVAKEAAIELREVLEATDLSPKARDSAQRALTSAHVLLEREDRQP